MTTNDEKNVVIEAVKKASELWKSAFNSGDAAGCAAQYEKDAVMEARPFGTFTGTPHIQAFWQRIMDEGLTGIEYLDPKIEVVDSTSAVLTAGWKMNKASGVIHKELWILQKDGTAKLREDDFEAQG